METGTVKWFNATKGFGFITSDAGDIFVHFSTIDMGGYKSLQQGEEVEYKYDETVNGLRATYVKRLEE